MLFRSIYCSSKLLQSIPHSVLDSKAFSNRILEIARDHPCDLRELGILQYAVDNIGIHFSGVQRHCRLIGQAQFLYIKVTALREIGLTENEIGGHPKKVRNLDDVLVPNLVCPPTEEPAEGALGYADGGGKFRLWNFPLLDKFRSEERRVGKECRL